jgi:hypothetical protein
MELASLKKLVILLTVKFVVEMVMGFMYVLGVIRIMGLILMGNVLSFLLGGVRL